MTTDKPPQPICNCGADRTGPSAEAHLDSCPAAPQPGGDGLDALVAKWRKDDGDPALFRKVQRDCAGELAAALARERKGQLTSEQRELLAIRHCPWDTEQEDEGDPLPEPHCHANRDGECSFAYCPQPLLLATLQPSHGETPAKGEKE